MCRLFGLIANKPVDVAYTFYLSPKSMAKLAARNPHGWGVAWLDEKGDWGLVKEPVPLDKSIKAIEFVKERVRVRIIISHVRFATVESYTHGDTHPWLYHRWVFAHNGSINRDMLLELVDDNYRDFEGSTDSEVLFHFILQNVEELNNPVEGIRMAVDKVVEREIPFSSLNLIASDGEKLYALRYASVDLEYYTLYYLNRPSLEVGRLSEETRLMIRMKIVRGEEAVLVASEPLSDETGWRLIPNKTLLVADRDLNVKLINI